MRIFGLMIEVVDREKQLNAIRVISLGMGISRFFKPNIDKMMKKGDVDGLIRLLRSKDVDLRKRAAEALAPLIVMKDKPKTLSDVKEILDRDATNLFSFRQEGDKVYAKEKLFTDIPFST